MVMATVETALASVPSRHRGDFEALLSETRNVTDDKILDKLRQPDKRE